MQNGSEVGRQQRNKVNIDSWGPCLVRVGLDGNGESAAQPQVGNFEAQRCFVHKQVLRLEVPVHDAVLVAVRHPLYQLVHEALHRQPTPSAELDLNLKLYGSWTLNQGGAGSA